MSTSIIVYGPNGPERHSRANARDLVNGAGYSWHPNVKSTPTAYAPFAGAPAPEGPQPSQRVLDSVGGSASGASGAAQAAAAAQAEQQRQIQAALAAQAAPIAPAAPVEVVDYSTPPPVDASDLDDPADAEPEDAEVVPEDSAPVAEAAPAAKPALTEVPRARGRPRKA